MENFSEAIISIRPNFAEAILSGVKSIELRRRIPYIGVSTRLWIYATRPVGAVVGSATVKRIIRGSPEEVWAESKSRAAIDRHAYNTYFDGAQEAVGLVLANVRRGNAISIEMLRSVRPGFHPPQVIAKISGTEAKLICKLSMSSSKLTKRSDKKRM